MPANAEDGSSRAVPEETSPNNEVAAATTGSGPTETLSDPGDVDEGRDAYRPGGFHPVYIGDVYADRYKIMNKVGYGVYSIMWLVKDLTKPALKVLSADCYGTDKDVFKREILTHLRDGDRGQPGYRFVCHLVDDFEHQGPNGTHVCLVFELMGETLRSFGAWFKESMIPHWVMRKFTIELLAALDFVHDHNVIHTDIKPDNIFVKFRDTSLIESGYLVNVPIPQQDRSEERYSTVKAIPLSRYYFDLDDPRQILDLDIALGDWGVSSWATQHLTENIQPVALRAPEVLIKAPWDKTTDWWNLGAVVFELYCAVRMFSGRVPPDGHHEVQEHVAEIVDLFGPFPKELLEKGNQDLVQNIFYEDGKLKDFPPMGRPPLASEMFMPGLKQEARDLFASFLKTLMKINPTELHSAAELLKHPWLRSKK